MANRYITGVLRGVACLAALASLLFCMGCSSLHSVAKLSQPGAATRIRIGAPDGVGGLLVASAATRTGACVTVQPADVSPIRDCCSSIAQWALSSQSVDAAVVCLDAAEALVQKDRRYVIVGPCLANSDLVVVRDRAKAARIGITQNHRYQAEIVKRLFGPPCQAVPMWAGSLPYAYEKGAVDGVVLDVTEALRLPGIKLASGGGADEVITGVLVARQDCLQSAELGQFVRNLAESAVELNDPARLQQAINSYAHYPATGTEASQWMQLGIHFIPLKSSASR